MEDEPSLECSLPTLEYDDTDQAELAAELAQLQEEEEQAAQLCHMQRQNTVGAAFENFRSEGVSARCLHLRAAAAQPARPSSRLALQQPEGHVSTQLKSRSR
jgi:hypothetical protein